MSHTTIVKHRFSGLYSGRYWVWAKTQEQAKTYFSRIWGVTDFSSLTLVRPNVYSVLKPQEGEPKPGL